MSGGRTPSGPTEGGPQLEPHGGDSPLLVRSGLWSEDLPWRRPLLSAGLSWTGDLDWHGALWGRDARGRVRRLSWRLSYVWLAALAQGDAMDPALLRFRRMLTGDFSRPLTGPQHAQQNLPALQAQQRRRTGQRARAPLPLRAPAGFIREVWIPSQKEGQEKVVRYEPPKTTTQGVPKRRPDSAATSETVERPERARTREAKADPPASVRSVEEEGKSRTEPRPDRTKTLASGVADRRDSGKRAAADSVVRSSSRVSEKSKGEVGSAAGRPRRAHEEGRTGSAPGKSPGGMEPQTLESRSPSTPSTRSVGEVPDPRAPGSTATPASASTPTPRGSERHRQSGTQAKSPSFEPGSWAARRSRPGWSLDPWSPASGTPRWRLDPWQPPPWGESPRLRSSAIQPADVPELLRKGTHSRPVSAPESLQGRTWTPEPRTGTGLPRTWDPSSPESPEGSDVGLRSGRRGKPIGVRVGMRPVLLKVPGGAPEGEEGPPNPEDVLRRTLRSREESLRVWEQERGQPHRLRDRIPRSKGASRRTGTPRRQADVRETAEQIVRKLEKPTSNLTRVSADRPEGRRAHSPTERLAHKASLTATSEAQEARPREATSPEDRSRESSGTPKLVSPTRIMEWGPRDRRGRSVGLRMARVPDRAEWLLDSRPSDPTRSSTPTDGEAPEGLEPVVRPDLRYSPQWRGRDESERRKKEGARRIPLHSGGPPKPADPDLAPLARRMRSAPLRSPSQHWTHDLTGASPEGGASPNRARRGPSSRNKDWNAEARKFAREWTAKKVQKARSEEGQRLTEDQEQRSRRWTQRLEASKAYEATVQDVRQEEKQQQEERVRAQQTRAQARIERHRKSQEVLKTQHAQRMEEKRTPKTAGRPERSETKAPTRSGGPPPLRRPPRTSGPPPLRRPGEASSPQAAGSPRLRKTGTASSVDRASPWREIGEGSVRSPMEWSAPRRDRVPTRSGGRESRPSESVGEASKSNRPVWASDLSSAVSEQAKPGVVGRSGSNDTARPAGRTVPGERSSRPVGGGVAKETLSSSGGGISSANPWYQGPQEDREIPQSEVRRHTWRSPSMPSPRWAGQVSKTPSAWRARGDQLRPRYSQLSPGSRRLGSRRSAPGKSSSDRQRMDRAAPGGNMPAEAWRAPTAMHRDEHLDGSRASGSQPQTPGGQGIRTTWSAPGTSSSATPRRGPPRRGGSQGYYRRDRSGQGGGNEGEGTGQEAGPQAGLSGKTSWSSPVARRSSSMGAEAPPKRPRRRAAAPEEPGIETLSEKEMLNVLRTLAQKSPEARTLLQEVRRQVAEHRYFWKLRQY